MILRGRLKCMTPKFVGIQWYLVTQMNNKLRGTSVLVNIPEHAETKYIINLFS